VSWSLALTRPQTEFAVSRAIERWWPEQKHIVFRIRKRIVCRGKVIEVERPAWPRYLFLHEIGSIWVELRERISGLADLVRQGSQVAILPDGVVNSLLAVSNDLIIPTPDVAHPRFHYGDRVIIHSEKVALDRQVAIFQRLVTESQALVEIDWFGRPVPVQLDERNLLPFVEVKPREAPRRKKRHRRNRRKRSDASGSLVTING
jgi:transcription antitermination factor NusG